MNKKMLEQMEQWDKITKRQFNKCLFEWMESGWSRKVAFKEAYKDTLIYLKEKKEQIK